MRRGVVAVLGTVLAVLVGALTGCVLQPSKDGYGLNTNHVVIDSEP